MEIGSVLDLMEEARMSPEQLSESVRVSGMTMRRWMKKPRTHKVPPLYAPAIRQGCYELIAEGKLQMGSPVVQAILKDDDDIRLKAALKNLGLSAILPDPLADVSDESSSAWLHGLTEIGSDPKRQKEVDESQQKISTFKKLSQSWAERIGALWEVLKAREASTIEKLVAYGALFYLITPFDLIPDSIPVYGLLDDYAILGIAAAFCARRNSA